LEIDVPNFKKMELKHLVMDYNGTLACDGVLVSGVKEVLKNLSKHLQIHIVTADTYGEVEATFAQEQYQVKVLPQENQAQEKLNYIRGLHTQNCVCIGNGRNDRLMLQEAELSLAVLLEEGLSVETLEHADILFNGIIPALKLFENPLRIKATLRS